MKKILFLLLTLALTQQSNAQSRGIKIGYIDMEYILQNVPDYAQANNELEQKAQKWKQEIEVKRGEITKLKDALKTERVLLTKELIEEREEEIAFQEKELLDYQQKRFGPTGDLITQKSVLIKPIQDQVFNATQDIAENKKFDFILDKSSDLTILFAAKKYDISDQVIRVLSRSSRRQQMSKKELKEEAVREAKEDMIDENPALQERQKQLDEKKAAREKLIEDRKAAYEARKADQQAKRDQAKAEREAKKSGMTLENTETKEPTKDAPKETDKPSADKKETGSVKESTAAEKAAETQERKKDTAEERARALEERKRLLDEKRKEALEKREAQKKAKADERAKATTAKDSTKQ